MKPAELIKHLEKYDPDMEICAVLWNQLDVLNQADEMGIDCSVNAAQAIIRDMDRYHDTCVGINWETIEYFIREMEQERKRL